MVSPDHGNNGGWYPNIQWNSVRPVELLTNEFCAYSAYGKYWHQSCCWLLQNDLKKRPIS